MQTCTGVVGVVVFLITRDCTVVGKTLRPPSSSLESHFILNSFFFRVSRSRTFFYFLFVFFTPIPLGCWYDWNVSFVKEEEEIIFFRLCCVITFVRSQSAAVWLPADGRTAKWKETRNQIFTKDLHWFFSVLSRFVCSVVFARGKCCVSLPRVGEGFRAICCSSALVNSFFSLYQFISSAHLKKNEILPAQTIRNNNNNSNNNNRHTVRREKKEKRKAASQPAPKVDGVECVLKEICCNGSRPRQLDWPSFWYD